MKTKDEITAMSLGHLLQLAIRSYNWISQSPDGRGMRDIEAYSDELDSDIETIKAAGATTEEIDGVKKKYADMLSKWYHSQSNCASSFVCGPANFPVRSQEKKHKWADNHYKAFRDWREKMLKAYERRAKGNAIEAAGGELEINKKKLAEMEANQEHMKKMNEVYRKYLKNPQSLIDADISEFDKQAVISFVPEYPSVKKMFRGYRLTNNLANIKRVRARVADLEKRQDAKAAGNGEIPFTGGKVILNTQADRLQIMYDSIPSPEIRTSLKSHGFRWSPFHKAWQRQLTDNAKFATKRLLNIDI